MRIYLAGPDVFHPDALKLGEEKKRICTEYGFTGVFPFDEDVPAAGRSPQQHGLAISEKDFRLARSCDVTIVNLTPFHGPSMDVGSAVELGYMLGLGRLLYGYSNTPAPFNDRVSAAYGTAAGDPDHTPDGMTIESFGLTDNLMVDGAVHAAGGKVFRPDTGQALPFEDLSMFRLCLQALQNQLRNAG